MFFMGGDASAISLAEAGLLGAFDLDHDAVLNDHEHGTISQPLQGLPDSFESGISRRRARSR
jgi:hypothetical protein